MDFTALYQEQTELQDHITKRLTAAYENTECNTPRRCAESNKWTDMMLIGGSKDRVIDEWVKILKERSGIDQIAVASSIGRYAILVPHHLEDELRPIAETCLPGLRHYYTTVEGPKEFPSFFGPDSHPSERGLAVSWYTVDSHNYVRLVSANTTNDEIRRWLDKLQLSVGDDFLDSLNSYQRGCLSTWAWTISEFWDRKSKPKLDEVRGVDICPEFFKEKLPKGFLEKINAESDRRLEYGQKEIQETRLLVKATGDEKMYIWSQLADKGPLYTRRGTHQRYSWVQGRGYGREAGKIDGNPVPITVFWDTVGGEVIGFWEMQGRYMDDALAEAWLDETFPGVPRTTASEFMKNRAYYQERNAETEERMPTEEEISETGYLVEATPMEMHDAKDRWALNDDGTNPEHLTKRNIKGIVWTYENSIQFQVGELGGKPVVIRLIWATIKGRRIACWSPVSEAANTKMIRDWLEETFPGVGNTNASNFSHALPRD
jgi:hypothetical protein